MHRLGTRPVPELEDALRQFHSRDWQADIEFLNGELAGPRAKSARLENSPPSIITGDPFALRAGNCILVVGINPGWPPRARQAIDCVPAQRAWQQGFECYRRHRRSYFDESDGRAGRTTSADPRYSPHFSRLGNFIANATRQVEPEWEPGPTARKLFREQAAIFDLLPYWSRNTKDLDRDRVHPERQVCMAGWRQVLRAFITEKRPTAIIVNSSGNRDLICRMLECSIHAVPETSFYAGHREVDGVRTPVLAHRFLSSWRRTKADYVAEFQRSTRHLGPTAQS